MRDSFFYVRESISRLTNTRAPHPRLLINSRSYTAGPDGWRAAWVSWQVLACWFKCALVAVHPYLNYFFR